MWVLTIIFSFSLYLLLWQQTSNAAAATLAQGVLAHVATAASPMRTRLNLINFWNFEKI